MIQRRNHYQQVKGNQEDANKPLLGYKEKDKDYQSLATTTSSERGERATIAEGVVNDRRSKNNAASEPHCKPQQQKQPPKTPPESTQLPSQRLEEHSLLEAEEPSPHSSSPSINETKNTRQPSKQLNGFPRLKDKRDKLKGNANSNMATCCKKWLQYSALLSIVGLAGILCLYQIRLLLNQGEFEVRLKMVNVFSRHGDRAPSDGFQWNDPHRDKIHLYWPNGLSNLTDIGLHRQFKLGLKLRQLYENYLTFNPKEILALSSPISRCQVSIGETLRALYNMETDLNVNRQILRGEQSCVVEHKGNVSACGMSRNSFKSGMEAWKEIQVSTEIVPTLTWQYLTNCPWRKLNPSPFDADSLLDPTISRLKGIKKLERLLIDHYKMKNLNYTLTAIFGTVFAEMNIYRSEDNFNDTNHFMSWVDLPAADAVEREEEVEEHPGRSKEKPKPTLFDLIEEATVNLYNDRIVDKAALIQLGPIFTSIVDGFSLALNRPEDVFDPKNLEYLRDRKLIYYSTHDTILVNIMNVFDMIDFESPYESRFEKFALADDISQFLNGLRMPAFGASLRFELVEMESLESRNKGHAFHYVQAFLYNTHDIKFSEINYQKLKLGSHCSSLFNKLYPEGSVSDYYDEDFAIDNRFACPFELFKNLTARFMMDRPKLEKLCNESQ